MVDIVRGTWELENVGGPYSLGFKNLEAIPTNICVLKVISIFCGVRASKFLAIVSSYLFFKCPYDIEVGKYLTHGTQTKGKSEILLAI